MPDKSEVTGAPPATGTPSETTTAPAVESRTGDVVEPWLRESTTNPPSTSDKAAGTGAPDSPPASPAKEPTPDIEKLVTERAEKLAAEKAEAVRRKAQSEADQRIYQERIRAQAEARAALERQLSEAAEIQKIQAMDDEDFGKHVRQKATENAQRQAIENEIRAREALNWVNTIRALAEQSLSDEDKEEFRQKDTTNQFKDFGEAWNFVTERRAAREVAKAKKDLEKTIREVIEKERTAKETETDAPVLDSGTPTPSASRASRFDNIDAGIGDLISGKRKK